MSERIAFKIAAVVWATVIFLASSVTLETTAEPLPGGDKIVHIAFYAILAYFVLCGWCIAKNKTLRKKEVVVVLTVIILYGISDEFHQSFVPGRQPSGYDVLADGVGGLLGLLVLGLQLQRRNNMRALR
ncbi:MAG: VanZ family protein [Gammaproteobacteria bacterium]